MVALYEDWVRQYPIISIEDGLGEGDWDGWKTLTTALGKTRAARRRRSVRHQPGDPARGIKETVANSILVKLNQIGTVTETLDAVAMARDAGYTSVISHRSGETEDTTIADLAVGTGAGQIKTGSASRTRSRREVQPAAAHRRGARRRREVRRPRRDQAAANADHAQTRSAPARRVHLEQGKPLHRAGPTSISPTKGAPKRAKRDGC